MSGKEKKLIELLRELQKIDRKNAPKQIGDFVNMLKTHPATSKMFEGKSLTPNTPVSENEESIIKKALGIGITIKLTEEVIEEPREEERRIEARQPEKPPPPPPEQLEPEKPQDKDTEVVSRQEIDEIGKILLQKAHEEEKKERQAKKELIEEGKRLLIGSRFGEQVQIKTKPKEEIFFDRRREKHQKKHKKEISKEEVERQAKITLSKVIQTEGDSKFDREKRARIREKIREKELLEEEERKKLRVIDFIPLSDFAQLINVPPVEIQRKCIELGYPLTINQSLPTEVIHFLAEMYGYKVEIVDIESILKEDIEQELEGIDIEYVVRPPVVVVMGHVDHGKTTLLDKIRHTNVAAQEAGGITQHIGAYTVSLPSGKTITFIDTPGHEAFTALRARGASVTDIAIIVVAADDGVMPQTIEALNHARNSQVSIIFAINKIDKPEANIERVYKQLADLGYLVEDWGGEYPVQPISAKYGKGIDELLEKIIIMAELMEDRLRVRKNGPAKGVVLESSVKKGMGPVATLLVQEGTLKLGDIVIAGATRGRVRALIDSNNVRLKEALPGIPVLVPGFEETPIAGDKFFVVNDEKRADSIVKERQYLMKLQRNVVRMPRISLATISSEIFANQKDTHTINIVLKTDTDSSGEAIQSMLESMSNEKVKVKVVHRWVGFVSESDVMLAKASDGIIIGFNVSVPENTKKLAQIEGVEIRLYSIIYQIEEDIKKAIEGILAPPFKEVITGSAQVRKVFNIKDVGNVAGCFVTEGKIFRNSIIRVVRNGNIVWEGNIRSLKRYKDDVTEVSKGYECGILLDGYNDIYEGDVLVALYKESPKQ